MESILRCFSPGFCVLTHGDQPLAYMYMLDREAPRDQWQKRFSFYETMNEELWNHLATCDGEWSLIAVLQREMDQERLKWTIIKKLPTGKMTKRVFDTSRVTIEEDESDGVVTIGGRKISKIVKLGKPLHELPSVVC